MLSLPEIKKLLEDRQLNVVAERVGIHSNTIYRLVKFERAEYDTIKKLSDYLEGQLENAKKKMLSWSRLADGGKTKMGKKQLENYIQTLLMSYEIHN